MLVTARSLTADGPALVAHGASGAALTDATPKISRIDVVGPPVPPYEATVSLFSASGRRDQTRVRVTSVDGPSPAQVQAEVRRREACRADAGNPGRCEFPKVTPDRPLTGVTATSLARAVTARLSNTGGVSVKGVTCRAAWSRAARFTLSGTPMRVTYRLRSAGAPGCWRLRGWSFTTRGPSNAALPLPTTGCV